MKTINANIKGTPTDTPVCIADNGPTAAGWISGQRVSFDLPDGARTGTGATIVYAAGSKQLRVLVPPIGAWEADQPPVKPGDAPGPIELDYTPRAPRLYAHEDSLVDGTGRRVTLGLATSFRLYQMFLRGEDTTAVRQQCRAAGAQGYRVFGTCDFLFKLDPRVFGGNHYYDQLPAFARMLEADGEYLQFTACADLNQGVLESLDGHDHFNRCCDALGNSPNVVIVEAGNENIKNGVDARNWGKPNSVITSSGSFCDGWEPTGTWGDVMTFHPRRDWKWWFTVPATAQELRSLYGNKPIWIGEPIGAADADRADRSCNPALFELLGVSIGVFAAGGVFHSDAGLQSARWSDRQYACAEAFFRGIHR